MDKELLIRALENVLVKRDQVKSFDLDSNYRYASSIRSFFGLLESYIDYKVMEAIIVHERTENEQ